MTLKAVIQNDLTLPCIPDPKQFQLWVNAAVKYVENQIPKNINEVCIRIVDRIESAELNRTFREKEGPTNVLSFADLDLEDESLGDLAICAELVASEAENLGIAIKDHWAHLTVHGILHLLNYDHINDQDAEEMEALEIKILKTLDIDNPYEEPPHD
ncbi:MAG: rRNA maturation RNase YbeY [Coxiellaceae bacterium]|nr:rRNA maturation RNase YbeY [Coxiellaceae bacterium]